MRAGWPLLALLLAGCTRNAPPPGSPQAAASGNQGPGTFAQPIVRCGPRDSYHYVAREFRCSDGQNPFGGELERAARSRQGGRQHPGGHIVDLYQVPCTGGDVTVYVDMYGCPEQQVALDRGPSPEFKAATEAFDEGNFPESVRQCMEIVDRETVDRNTIECLALTPAAMALSGGEPQALKLVGGFCSKLPTGGQQKVRIQHVEQIARWVFRGAKGRISKEEFRKLVGRFATACGVNDDQGA